MMIFRKNNKRVRAWPQWLISCALCLIVVALGYPHSSDANISLQSVENIAAAVDQKISAMPAEHDMNSQRVRSGKPHCEYPGCDNTSCNSLAACGMTCSPYGGCGTLAAVGSAAPFMRYLLFGAQRTFAHFSLTFESRRPDLLLRPPIA